MGDYRSGRGKYKGILSASYFTGEGSGITGVTGEWDGTHVGNAEITGTLNVTQAITASAISASVYVGDGSGLTNVVTYPGGSNTHVQYNDAGSFTGSANLTFDGTTLTVVSITASQGIDPQGAGSNSVQVGLDASAAGNGALAIGLSASGDGGSSIAIGILAKGSDTHSVAIGSAGAASAGYATAIGPFGKASGLASTAIGAIANASASYSTAIGYFAQATHTNSIAMGHKAQATAENSIAIGSGSVNATANTMTIGNSAQPMDLYVTGTVSASAYYGDGSNLTGVSAGGGAGFPFVGDAELTGSLLMRNGLSMNYNLLSQSLSIPAEHNASIVGPIGIAPGVTIDILVGSEMVIL